MGFAQLSWIFVLCIYYYGQVSPCDECEELKTEVRVLNEKIQELEQSINNLNTNTVKRNESEVRKRSIPQGNVAFSTSLSTDLLHIGLAQTIKFDNVLLNDGQGYNTYSGVFVAPQSGVYLFAYVFCHINQVSAGSQTLLELMHNGKRVNSAIVDSRQLSQDIQGTNIAIMRVDAGDSVWVQNYLENDASLYSYEGLSTFSGTLLYV